ncbi:MAG TPA: ABC transporter ATP-binding protein [Vicinamibacterales bacterium]|nr:ABC transporter ATP-binding protein [Vicinamibacterales bacterium]
MSNSAILRVEALHTYYGDSHVLQGVTLDAAEGRVTAVLGRNGVGKTTLCRSIVGLTPARRGRIILGGVDITRLPPHRIFRLGVALVPQGRRVFASLTVEENLAIACGGRRCAIGTAPRAAWTLETVYALFPRLGERRRHRGDELSGGEQQMLAIARALVANPVLLILDEPTEGLAPAIAAQVAALVRRLREEQISVLLVEQNAAFAARVADYVHVMSRGAVVHSSDPVALWADDAVKTQLLGVPGTPGTREAEGRRAEASPRPLNDREGRLRK